MRDRRRSIIVVTIPHEGRCYNSRILSIATTASRKYRSAREFVRGLVHTAHPLLVQIIPIRRCNIDCGYCNEYDKVSEPVPTAGLKSRINKLKQLGTAVVAFSGGA